MLQLRGKFAILLAVFLVLCQWLVLTHATEHVLKADNSRCAVCALGNHYKHFTVIDDIPLPVIKFPLDIILLTSGHYTKQAESTSAIRAPPEHPHI
jgi:hypothetical protein